MCFQGLLSAAKGNLALYVVNELRPYVPVNLPPVPVYMDLMKRDPTVYWESRACGLLAEALRTCGEWVSR